MYVVLYLSECYTRARTYRYSPQVNRCVILYSKFQTKKQESNKTSHTWQAFRKFSLKVAYGAAQKSTSFPGSAAESARRRRTKRRRRSPPTTLSRCAMRSCGNGGWCSSCLHKSSSAPTSSSTRSRPVASVCPAPPSCSAARSRVCAKKSARSRDSGLRVRSLLNSFQNWHSSRSDRIPA